MKAQLCPNYSLHLSTLYINTDRQASSPDSVKCSVSVCVMALWSFCRLFVISGKKNDRRREERHGEGEGGVFSSLGYF